MADTQDFLTTGGTTQSWVVPAFQTFVFCELWGAQGALSGGKGSFVFGFLPVTPGETLTLKLGFSGAAADIRQGGTALGDRVMVAGGGGGTGSFNYTGPIFDDGAVVRSGSDATISAVGAGGTVTGGNAPSGSAGSAGSSNLGGAGGSKTISGGVATGGRGGDGYFGAGGGAAYARVNPGNFPTFFAGAGGRGSSFLDPAVISGAINTNARTGAAMIRLSWGAAIAVAPNAPLLMYPGASQTIDLTQDQVLRWAFSHDNPGQTQSRWQLQLRERGDTLLVFDEDESNTDQTFTITASTLPAGSYEWRVRTYDSLSAVGPWSTWEPFEAAEPPEAPAITAPLTGATITDGIETFTWTVPAQHAFEIRRLNGSGTVVWTSGVIANAATRTYDVPFLINSVTEDVDIAVRVGAFWSSRSTITVDVAWAPPTTPTLTLQANVPVGAVRVTITNPAPDTPAIAYNDLFVRVASGGRADTGRPVGGDGIRIGAQLPADGDFDDYGVASGVPYEYRAMAVSDSGTAAYSTWTA